MKYFTIKELERSATAKRLGIDNTAPQRVVTALKSLVDNVLDPLRETWGSPITVSSGYRCPRLNKAVGGVATSHHLRGMAADITTGNRANNRRLFQKIIDLGLPFTQLIDESNFSWVHVSYDPKDVKRQILRL